MQGCQHFIGALVSGTEVQCYRMIGETSAPVSVDHLDVANVQQWLEQRFSILRLHATVQLEVHTHNSVFKIYCSA